MYLEVKGDNAGCFTNITGETNVKLDKVKFIGSKGTGDTAPIAI